MLTRRALLGYGAAPLLFSRGASAQSPTAHPAIAALPNRRAEAKPIAASERVSRCAQARRLMAEQKLNAICLSGGSSLYYFTGIHWHDSERLLSFVLPRDGASFYVSPAFEEERVREQLAQAPNGGHSRVYTWQEDADPYQRVAQGLRDSKVSAGRIGIEERMPFAFSDGIAKASPALQLVSATVVTAGCRVRKSPAELALLQLANDVTLQAYQAVWRSLRAGMTNRDAGALVDQAYHALGFPGEASVQVGEYSALPHGSVNPQTIREGSLLMMDDGCSVEGYQSDITRTFVLGKATSRMNQVFDVVQRAQRAALATARPGASCGSVDDAARKVITDAGFGPDYRTFLHRVGHGIGLDGHEWPYLVRGNRLPLAPGMTFSDEPGVYLRGEFGVRLEDCMYITEEGGKLFTPPSLSLEQPFPTA